MTLAWALAPKLRVLIVGDGAQGARSLLHALKEDGSTVELRDPTADGRVTIDTNLFDVVVVSNSDGAAVCRNLRAAGVTTPTLAIGLLKECVSTLDAGADDFVKKPYDIDEVRARMRALVRRTAELGRLRFGDLEIDRVGHRATLRGELLALSAKEFTMLIALAMRPNEIVTRPDLIGAASSTSNIVDVQISRLRDKLGAHRWMIETVRGRGYRFRTNPPLGS